MTTMMYSYDPLSLSAKALAKGLGIKLIRHTGSTYHPKAGDTIINWGSTSPWLVGARTMGTELLNHPEEVTQVVDKQKFFSLVAVVPPAFQHVHAPRVPQSSTKKEDAQGWLDAGKWVVCRSLLTSHSGKGITIVKDGELPDAKLYVEYIKKSHEFRVHFSAGGDVIAVQRKIRDPDREPTNWSVRSHANGFIFVRGGFETPPDVLEQARRAFQITQLDFGAVDVVSVEATQLAYVLEVNSAPGLTGKTIEDYANAIRKLLPSQEA